MGKDAKASGAYDAVLTNHWAEGGQGAGDLARAVAEACKTSKRENFRLLYDASLPIQEKIQILVEKIYGGSKVDYSEKALRKIKEYTEQGFDKLPICMAM